MDVANHEITGAVEFDAGETIGSMLSYHFFFPNLYKPFFFFG